MPSRSMPKAWTVYWFKLVSFWLPFFVGTLQQKDAGRK